MFVVKVDKVISSIEEKENITSGSQNVYVTKFEFSDEWQYLERTARFRSGDKVIDILLDDTNKCMIPWEVMTKAKVAVEVGVYGVKDGNVVLPTIWASMPVILQSVLGEDDASWPSEPTPDVYQQVLARLGEIENKIGEGSASELIDRCVWIKAAGDDISLFENEKTNVAAPDEFIGHTPTVSSDNVGLILVNNKLYWTKFDIITASKNSVTQKFTQNPVFIGPMDNGDLSESTLFIGNYNRAPKVNDYFNITPDRIYGSIPKNDDSYTLIMFTPDGVFDCSCVVVDYTPGKWATQVKVTTVSGSSDKDDLLTIKDTTIANISQLPMDKLPCCIHLINSYLGFLYNDDIVYVKSEGPLIWVYTINGATATLTVGLDGQINVNKVEYDATTNYVDDKVSEIGSGQNGKSAYEIAVDDGFEGTEEEWLESLKGPKGDPGETNNVYSTEETVIGRLMDGKPIYRKCFQGFPSQEIGIIDNLELIINVGGCVTDQSTNTLLTLNSGHESWGLFVYAQTNTGAVVLGSIGGAYDNCPAYLWVEYTKTTD